jgi:2'-5' RNA ligase
MRIPPRSRLFVALEPPPEARRALAATARDLAGRVDGRPVRAEAIHLTLAFLGEVAPERGDALAEAVRAALAGPALQATPGAIRALPARSRARVLARELIDDDGALATRAQAVRAAVAEAAGIPPERRPFLAHLTLARLRRPARIASAALDLPREHAFAFSRGSLYHSERRGGAPPRYEALVTLDLE